MKLLILISILLSGCGKYIGQPKKKTVLMVYTVNHIEVNKTDYLVTDTCCELSNSPDSCAKDAIVNNSNQVWDICLIDALVDASDFESKYCKSVNDI